MQPRAGFCCLKLISSVYSLFHVGGSHTKQYISEISNAALSPTARQKRPRQNEPSWSFLTCRRRHDTYSRSRRPATDDTGSEKQIAPALVAGPACSLMARMIAAFSSACAII